MGKWADISISTRIKSFPFSYSSAYHAYVRPVLFDVKSYVSAYHTHVASENQADLCDDGISYPKSWIPIDFCP